MTDRWVVCMCFFFNDTATTEIYTLSLHDALPISERFEYHQTERFDYHPTNQNNIHLRKKREFFATRGLLKIDRGLLKIDSWPIRKQDLQ